MRNKADKHQFGNESRSGLLQAYPPDDTGIRNSWQAPQRKNSSGVTDGLRAKVMIALLMTCTMLISVTNASEGKLFIFYSLKRYPDANVVFQSKFYKLSSRCRAATKFQRDTTFRSSSIVISSLSLRLFGTKMRASNLDSVHPTRSSPIPGNPGIGKAVTTTSPDPP